MPGLNTERERERESVRKKGSVCEREVRERWMEREWENSVRLEMLSLLAWNNYL